MNIQPPSPDGGPQIQPQGKKQQLIQERKDLRESFVEQFQPDQFAQIDAAWKANPDMRLGVLEKAKQLATDPNYPTPAQLSMLAKMIVGQELPMPPTMPPTVEPAPVVTPAPGVTPTPVSEPIVS